MPKLVILTQYYPPETGAPQNRLHSLSINMKKQGYDVSVFTGMPNYPKMELHDEYKRKWFGKETIDGIVVWRSWLLVTEKSSIIFRLLNYFSFCFTSFFRMLLRMKKSDVLVCESPPLFLGMTAVLISWIKRTPLVFNVSDLWPKSAEELGLITNQTIIGMTTWLEEWIYKRSKAITGQTQGIVADIKERFPNKPIHWLPNGVDAELLARDIAGLKDLREELGISAAEFVICYAGIIGHAQGLEIVIETAKALRNEAVTFILAGSGPVLESLEKAKQEHNLEKVIFLGPLPKSDMPSVIATQDAAFIPLKKSKLFLGAIPSKLFENSALKKPLLLGVDGEAKALFIDQGKAGLFYEPENTAELVKCIKQLMSDKALVKELGENGRAYVSTYFNRENIAISFHEFLKDSVIV
ncbi:MAG: glycosyltransferase family 4 protein [Flavobacteriales bacterium]